jgi:hypothetical protein
MPINQRLGIPKTLEGNPQVLKRTRIDQRAGTHRRHLREHPLPQAKSLMLATSKTCLKKRRKKRKRRTKRLRRQDGRRSYASV